MKNSILLALALSLSFNCTLGDDDQFVEVTEAEFCFDYVRTACEQSVACAGGTDEDVQVCVVSTNDFVRCELWDDTYCADGWNGWNSDAALDCIDDTQELTCGEAENPASCDYALVCGGLSSY